MTQGFKRPRKIYKLVFADDEMNGLEVRCRSVSINTMLELTALADLGNKRPGEYSSDDLQRVDAVFVAFATALESWNLQDEDGAPVPATLDGVRAQDIDFINVVIKAWMERVAGISVPLGPSSTDGVRSLEASIPMETLSPNQPNLQEQS